jgi:hypothetical protein
MIRMIANVIAATTIWRWCLVHEDKVAVDVSWWLNSEPIRNFSPAVEVCSGKKSNWLNY